MLKTNKRSPVKMVTLSPELKKRLEAAAAENEISASAYVRVALVEKLMKSGKADGVEA